MNIGEMSQRIKLLEERIDKDTAELQRLKEALGDFDPRGRISRVQDV